ncbi:MAG: hypothetical protein JSR66_17470 [Proteobacteria bacterium]|nr:hypothetical protein [Pseudomonadota bacterium]
MLPLWRDEVVIYIAPRRVALARRARGLRPRTVSETEIAVNGQYSDFGPTLTRLEDALTEPAWRNAAARVIVADSWVRYSIVPWPTERLPADGRMSYARFVMGESYGDCVSDWHLSLSDTPPGQAYVACAMPLPLRTRLQDALTGAGLTLTSLQPQLVVAFNAWRRHLPADDAWFVSLDDSSLAAIHLSNGEWDRVHTARVCEDWTVELDRLQAFGRLQARGNNPVPMLVDAPSWMRHVHSQSTQTVLWLDPGSNTQIPHELALLRRGYG